MDVNKIQILNNGLKNKEITIPIELTWDYLGMDQSIDEYEVEIIKQVTGGYGDFEVNRFAHAPILNPDPNSSIPFESTSIEYEFNFYSGGPLDVSANWRNDYISEGFTTQDIYYYENNFSNSFFKLDLYDNVDEKRQTNYITIIIPTQQGLTIDATMNRTPVKIKRPYFILDYVGDKEGFFIYWLRENFYININEFYMSAKFFNARRGIFVNMMNRPQSIFSASGNYYTFNKSNYFYYKVSLNYPSKTYEVYDTITGLRVGTDVSSINWYEYLNP
jgi:hypothetical protein